jgi:hypothetical protein
VLQRHYLPNEPETQDSLAAAIWLHRENQKQMTAAVTHGIAVAFNGS